MRLWKELLGGRWRVEESYIEPGCLPLCFSRLDRLFFDRLSTRSRTKRDREVLFLYREGDSQPSVRLSHIVTSYSECPQKRFRTLKHEAWYSMAKLEFFSECAHFIKTTSTTTRVREIHVVIDKETLAIQIDCTPIQT
jgi:hypothetical protein